MAQEALIAGNLINDDRPLAVEVQNDVLAVEGPLTDAELRATAVHVDVEAELPAGTQEIGSFADVALAAARAGLAFCQKLNAKTGINAVATVLTDVGLLKATAVGYRDIITCIYSHINTASDWCQFEIGATANADGSGAFTAMTPLFRIETPATKEANTPEVTNFSPPIIVTNAMGGAWTIRAQTNDAGASVTFGLNGWREAV